MSPTPAVQKAPFEGQVMSVTGPVDPASLGVTDAHNHLWIEAVQGGAPASPVLTGRDAILGELVEYRQAGGAAIVDCQPGGCGRNGTALFELSQGSGVIVIACTGFHRRVYYAPGWWLWEAGSGQAARYFVDEIKVGLRETLASGRPAQAGFIKVACEATVRDTPRSALQGAALAAVETGACVEVHTEKGADAEAILDFFTRSGVRPAQLVLCHMDKAPDFGLQRALAQAGVLLEYDTFYRPKYSPERGVWPLIEQMVAAGYAGAVALATDMAEASLWRCFGGGPGLAGLLTLIRPRLQNIGLSPSAIQQLSGGNIARRLAGMA